MQLRHYALLSALLLTVACASSPPDDDEDDQLDDESTGECSPELSDTCCFERLIDGELRTQCSQHVNECTGGPGCDNPARVYIRSCTAQGHYFERVGCEVTAWTGNEGTSAETVFNLCTTCETTGVLSCVNGRTLECRAGP